MQGQKRFRVGKPGGASSWGKPRLHFEKQVDLGEPVQWGGKASNTYIA